MAPSSCPNLILNSSAGRNNSSRDPASLRISPDRPCRGHFKGQGKTEKESGASQSRQSDKPLAGFNQYR
ncbi:hypothetical protein L209DRAFT_752176 [Thermothelomyces heterothallicus CBS 203.75]